MSLTHHLSMLQLDHQQTLLLESRTSPVSHHTVAAAVRQTITNTAREPRVQGTQTVRHDHRQHERRVRRDVHEPDITLGENRYRANMKRPAELQR